MSLAALPLPPGVRRLFDLALETVLSGVRRFRRGDANATAAEALVLIRRLSRLLRFAFVLAAAWLPQMAAAAHKRTVRTRGATLRRPPGLALFPPYRIVTVVPGARTRPQPAALACAERDPVRTAQRRLDALAAALFDPMPRIRRIARRLPAALMVIGWRPPKRPPPTHRRDYWEELVTLCREADFALGAYRRRTAAAA